MGQGGGCVGWLRVEREATGHPGIDRVQQQGERGLIVHQRVDEPEQRELVERALINSSKTKDIVLDAFGGSGSTMIACEKTGRRARLIELDPKYVDVIVKRWRNLRGKKLRLFAPISSSRTSADK